MIERKEYLAMCREVAGLGDITPLGIPRKIPDELLVLWGGAKYAPTGYEISFQADGTAVHDAVLHDLKAHAVIYAPLREVERAKERGE